MAYHHGDLRNAVMAEALALIREVGVSGVGFREVARRAGVAHTSVAHHFGDKTGLFTAIAVEGFGLLADELTPVIESDAGFLELGVAYVRFAVGHPAHFEVMFRPDLHRRDDPALVAATARTRGMLYGEVGELVGVAGWSMVHGIATLWLTDNLPRSLGGDPEAITRRVAALLGT